jgi:hypothetical protein
MQRKDLARFAPLSGVLFLVLAVIAGALAGEPPDADESALEHLEYWKDKEGSQVGAAIVGAYAAGALVWFAASVRDAIARVEPGPSRLASISFGGAVLVAAGLTVNSSIQFATADSVDELSPDTVHALSILYTKFFFPMALGTALFLFAAGLAGLRHGAFDRRLAWLAILIAVPAITPAGPFVFIAMIIWSAIAGIVLYRKKDPVGSGAEPPQTTGPPIELPPGAGPPAPS